MTQPFHKYEAWKAFEVQIYMMPMGLVMRPLRQSIMAFGHFYIHTYMVVLEPLNTAMGWYGYK